MEKILHMTPPDINNGVYRYIFNHMRYMDMQKYQFAFLTKGAEELKLTEEYRQYGFKSIIYIIGSGTVGKDCGRKLFVF